MVAFLWRHPGRRGPESAYPGTLPARGRRVSGKRGGRRLRRGGEPPAERVAKQDERGVNTSVEAHHFGQCREVGRRRSAPMGAGDCGIEEFLRSKGFRFAFVPPAVLPTKLAKAGAIGLEVPIDVGRRRPNPNLQFRLGDDDFAVVRSPAAVDKPGLEVVPDEIRVSRLAAPFLVEQHQQTVEFRNLGSQIPRRVVEDIAVSALDARPLCAAEGEMVDFADAEGLSAFNQQRLQRDLLLPVRRQVDQVPLHSAAPLRTRCPNRRRASSAEAAGVCRR